MGKVITALNTPNKTQNFYPVSVQDWEIKLMPFKASQALAEGGAVGIEIVTNDVTGNLTVMGTENASGADFVGILAETIATTDADYATAGKLKAVWIPKSYAHSEAFFTVTAGTFTAVDVFKRVEITSGSLGLSVDTAGKGATITSYISSTRGTCKFNMPLTETA